jgi:polar amino acid transport system substrate-binding protein
MRQTVGILLPGLALFVVWLAGTTAALAQELPDALDRIRERGMLIWGADQEGGGPYIFPDPADPNRLRGFEVELAELVARRLGVESRFAQGQWDKLPDLLTRGDIDIVLNGYEWSPVWHERYGTSIPYYIYELQFLSRAQDESLTTPDDLRLPGPRGKRRVAVLGGSAAEQYLQTHFGDEIVAVPYDGVTDALRAVELGTDGVEVTLQDTPIVTFYLDGFPGLKRVGDPVGLGYYVILSPRGETRLLEAINQAIVDSLRDGSLRRILTRYKLWNNTQQQRGLETDPSGRFSATVPRDIPGDGGAEEQPVEESYSAVRGWLVIQQRWPFLLAGAWLTIQLSVISMPLAILAGLLLAISRLYGPWWLARLSTMYVELVRGTPLVLQLYVIFFLLPETGFSIPAFWAAVLGLAINYSAYEAEIYRAGLQAIPQGQWEAAEALGMSRGLALRRIIIPQATRIVIPPMTNDFIALFKDTAVCSVITLVELSKEYYIHARSTGAVIELGILTALLYLGMSYPLALLAGYLEKRLQGERRA